MMNPFGAGCREDAALERPRFWRSLLSTLKAVRVHQWAKNLLVFVPLVLGHRFGEAEPWWRSAQAFLCLSLLASAGYLVNDLADLQADRRHPLKRQRPLAAGELPAVAALALAGALLLAGVCLAIPLPSSCRWLLLLYIATSLAYSLHLKTRLLLDVVVLAGLYTLRVFLGGAASGTSISQWTLAFAVFLFHSLALMKRFVELRNAATGQPDPARRGYQQADTRLLPPLGIASGYLSVLVLAIFLQTPEVQAEYSNPRLLWLLCPVLLYWISRMWILANRGLVMEDAILFALRDKASYAAGLVGAAIFVLAIFSR